MPFSLRRRLARSEAERNKKWFLMPCNAKYQAPSVVRNACTVTLIFNYTMSPTVEQLARERPYHFDRRSHGEDH